MKSYILAIDQGTTSTRALLVDQKANISSHFSKTFKQYFPKQAWVEHDPEEIWQSTLDVCRKVIKDIGDVSKIKALGITNQRETTIVWDRKTGKPIYPAIVWQDRRTAECCNLYIEKGIGDKISYKTGLLLDSYFSATKIKWILDNVKGARVKAEAGKLAFGTVDSFLIWHLTAGKRHVTDVTNASRTLLFNINTMQWDDELLRIFQVPRSLLPKVLDNCADFGVCDKSLFGAELPITGVAGDQQASAFAHTCFEPNMVKVTYGTGGFLLVNTGKKIIRSKHRFLSTVLSRIDGKVQYALEGTIFIAGASIKWLDEKLDILSNPDESECLAKSLTSNEGVYMVPAFTGLGAPYWEPGALGSIFGLTRDSHRAHIVRAALESVCYSTRDLFDTMKADDVHVLRKIRVDGGMTKNDWFLSHLSDTVQLEICRSSYSETTAVGAAFFAGLHIGFFESQQQLASLWQYDVHKKPSADIKQINEDYRLWKLAVKSTIMFKEENL